MYPVWTSVKVKTPGAEREGEAGTVHATSPAHPDEVTVKFDSDAALVAVPVVDLETL